MARPRLDMKHAGSGLGIFLAGAVSVGVILVALMAAVVLPIKVSETRVVSGAAAAIAQDGGGSSGAGSSDESGSGETSASVGALTPAQIYERSSTGVVEVLATFGSGEGFFGPRSGSAQVLGSGFVVSEDGYILSNAHVVPSGST